jgi:glucose-6-phosphate 1-dehydrogenase
MNDKPKRSMAAQKRIADPTPPCTFVIFGATGDLTKRLLMPAFYNLAGGKLLDDKFSILGVGRKETSDEEFQAGQTEFMEGFAASKDHHGDKLDEASWGWLKQRLHYVAGEFDDPKTYKEIGRRIGDGNAVFYLAVPDQLFASLIDQLHEAGLTQQKEGMFRRVIIEKPFGHDLPSAIDLNSRILQKLTEDQIYRIDHFLGKETVQNIMALRFSNSIFEPLWNRDHIDSVQITAAEVLGVEQRGGFYEATGALRDMVPNHLFQLLAMVGMEPPKSFDSEDIRSEKAKLIGTIRPLTDEDVETDVVRGQYAAGRIGEKTVPAYTAEPDVAKDSQTETFVALKLMIDNWRWAGVPFYLRTGKRMAARKTEIVVKFRAAPMAMFRDTPVDELAPNVMVIHLQPDEGIALMFNAKKPGQTVTLDNVRMDFHYKDFFDLKPSTGYESLIYDVLIGDPTLFNRADNIEAGWRVVQPIIDAVAAGRANLHPYAAGTYGPEEANELLSRDGHSWRKLG